jgi:hypothetical protein
MERPGRAIHCALKQPLNGKEIRPAVAGQSAKAERRESVVAHKLAGSTIDPGQQDSLLVDIQTAGAAASRGGRRPTTHSNHRSRRNHHNGSHRNGNRGNHRSHGNHHNGNPKPSAAGRCCRSPCRRDGRSRDSHRRFPLRRGRSAGWQPDRLTGKCLLPAAWMRMHSPPAKGRVQRHPKPALRRLW